jgi:hypothetical protein
VREQLPQVNLMPGENHGLAARVVMTRPDVAGAPPLLDEFLDHAQRNLETLGNFRPVALLLIVGAQNPFPQIQESFFTPRTLQHLFRNAYSFI